ncbi:hypothetical protein ABW20_dc0104066 [Dactylellina cionopaga]|nr:hypothetical protein ABW20_dc0104066 [Dactylellina cionopaga]
MARHKPAVPFVDAARNTPSFCIFFRASLDENGLDKLKSIALPALIKGRVFEDIERNLQPFLSRLKSTNHPFCRSYKTSEAPGNLFESWRKIQFHSLIEQLKKSSLPSPVEDLLRTEIAAVGMGYDNHAAIRLLTAIDREYALEKSEVPAAVQTPVVKELVGFDLPEGSQPVKDAVEHRENTSVVFPDLFDEKSLSDELTKKMTMLKDPSQTEIQDLYNVIKQLIGPDASIMKKAAVDLGSSLKNFKLALDELDELSSLFDHIGVATATTAINQDAHRCF